MRNSVACLVAFATISTPALADDKWVVQPIQTGTESARFVKGVPTVELEMKDGIARITPLPLDHGMLSFTVAVYNDGERPMNFGIENVAPTFGGRPVRVLSKTQLVKKAQNRAFWSQFGLALLGGVAAGATASQRDYYTSSFVTPRGTYRTAEAGHLCSGRAALQGSVQRRNRQLLGRQKLDRSRAGRVHDQAAHPQRKPVHAAR